MDAWRLIRRLVPVVVLGTFILALGGVGVAGRMVWAAPMSETVIGQGADPVPTLPSVSRLWIPLAPRNWCSPIIEFTHVPAYGSMDDLQGRVQCAPPDDYRVAIYIFVSGWWTKPYFGSPLTAIRADGTWTCDITTGGSDQLATRIAAFLIPQEYDPPRILGGQTLPAELYTRSAAHVIAERAPTHRQIVFSGYTWNVKASTTLAGPGPNYFSDRAEDVWVDKDGLLHLRIVHRDGRWYCTEVFTEQSLGYGKYIFRLSGPVDQLDRNVVLGLFTWDGSAPEHNYREIDIELGRWGQPENDDAQYVIQPWQHAGNMYRFPLALDGQDSTYAFDWQIDRVFFQSLRGRQPFPGPVGQEMASWTYTGGDLPPAGQANARINLWLLDGAAPADGQEVEVVVTAFEFVPAAD